MGPAASDQSTRCAVRHAAEHVDPVGTAPHWDAVLVVEIPGPWPRDISEAEPFSALCDPPTATITGADGRIWRPQGVVPADPGAGTRVMSHEVTAGRPGPMARREWYLPGRSVEPAVALCAALLGGDRAVLARFEQYRDDPPDGTVDFLLCTHGRRDVCCGSSGTALFGEVEPRLPAGRSPGVRLFRSTHAGGHRFAPTGLSFPEGVSWSHLDADLLMSILRRDPDVMPLARHIRGAVHMPDEYAQVADREGFVEHGWDWFLSHRTATTRHGVMPADGAHVEIVGALSGIGTVRVTASVELAGRIPKLPCGAEEGTDHDSEPVWRAVAVGDRSQADRSQ